MSEKQKFLVVVQGPTAIGKTALSIALAKHFQSEIISADSRQFYKEMRIGTAVPSKEELNEIPHHFIHHKSIEEPYSAGDYEQDVAILLDQLFLKHTVVILTGGSGLYVNAVLFGLDDLPKADKDVRRHLNFLYKKEGIKALQQQLKQLDPVYYEMVDIENPMRLLRAIEVSMVTGKTYSSFLKQTKKSRRFTTLKIGLTAERKTIYQRIEQRVDLMMQEGLLEEVIGLYDKRHLNALQTVGYKELFIYLDNKCSLETAVEEIKKNTRRYAKRQLTWLRKDSEIQWFDYHTKVEEITGYINYVIKKKPAGNSRLKK